MIVIDYIFDDEFGEIAYILSDNKYFYVKMTLYKNSYIYEELPIELQKKLFNKYNIDKCDKGDNYDSKTR